MENNKAYLQKIHWVFFIAALYGVAFHFLPEWLKNISSVSTKFIVFESIFFCCYYSCIGIISSKWKETAVAAAISIGLYTVDLLLNQKTSFNLYTHILLYLSSSIPLTVFFGLQFGWTKKLVSIYVVLFIISSFNMLSFYSNNFVEKVTEALLDSMDYDNNSSIWVDVFSVITRASGFIFSIACIAELSNYMQGKKMAWKTCLLNPGNDYGKINSILLFWMMKVVMISVLFGSARFAQEYVDFTRGKNYYNPSGNSYSIYILIVNSIRLVSFIPAALFLAWYLRKFLLEYFMTYGLRSKFLYWLCLLPVIGTLVFVIAQFNSVKRSNYEEKTMAIGDFAASDSLSVTVIFLFLYTVLLFFGARGGDTAFIISLVLTILLFVLFTADSAGYAVNIGLNFFLLTTGVILIILAKWRGPSIPSHFAQVLFNTMQLILIFPVFYFDQFEYITPEKTEAVKPGELHLFG
jgi:hypothetical protein